MILEVAVYVVVGIMIAHSLYVLRGSKTGDSRRLEGLLAWLIAINILILWQVWN